MKEVENKHAKEIFEKRKQIDLLHQEINDIAKSVLPDFHFLDYKVSTFWSCEKSPIGVCVFHLNQWGHTTECRFCGDPEERK